MPDEIRVFVSYAHGEMGKQAAALSKSLRRMGATILGDEPSFGQDLREYFADAISAAQIMILLLSPGDELRPWIQYETQMMLRTCWKREDSRITVVAPAIGAIPGALRHRDFVQYVAHDEARLGQWTEGRVVDAFAKKLLGASTARSIATIDPITDDEIRAWRNRLVHISTPSGIEDGPERQRLVDQLREDLDRFASNPDMSQSERLLDRAMLAVHLGESELVEKYYGLLAGRKTEATPERDMSLFDPSALGLIAFQAGDYERSRDLLLDSLPLSENRYGPAHPVTIGILNYLGLSGARLGRTFESRELLQLALLRSRNLLGDLHPLTARIAYNLGMLLHDDGQVHEAREALELAANAYRAVRPPDSTELSDVLDSIERLGHAGDR